MRGQGGLAQRQPGRAACRRRRPGHAGSHADPARPGLAQPARGPPARAEPLLVEEYLPGPELSIDGLLDDNGLTPLAVFDKPATPDGPTFGESLLVTPSRLPGHVVADTVRTAGQAARALGLTAGPVHAELRVTRTGNGTATRAAMLELAARSIGGLCSRALRFPGGRSLEELILASALGRPLPAGSSELPRPCGIFMLPVPRAGVLRAVEGRAAAEAVPGVTGVTITMAPALAHPAAEAFCLRFCRVVRAFTWLSVDLRRGSPCARTYSGQRVRREHQEALFPQVICYVEVQAVAVCKTVGSAYVDNPPMRIAARIAVAQR